MSRRHRFSPGGLALFTLLVGAGCGQKPFEVSEAEGTVTIGGAPLVGVEVTFMPTADPKLRAPSSSGRTDERGQYRLTCQDGRPGAVVGTHRVAVRQRAPGKSDPRGLPPGSRTNPPIPPQYLSVVETPLQVEVTPERHTYDLNLTP
jgi:hypothetical protein